MIRQELVDYLKQAKADGHSMESAKSVLVQQGWSEGDINESLLALIAPIAPVPASAPAPFMHQEPIVPISAKKVVEKKVPDFYISPTSVLLSILVFFCVFVLAGQLMKDIESVVAPFSVDNVVDSAPYQIVSEKYLGKVPADQAKALQAMWTSHHAKDRVNHLFVVGFASALFWVLAFVVHFFVGGANRQYFPLSVPFFLTAGIYLIGTLFEIISRLFQVDAQYAVYATLIVFIIIVTISFMFYQKRENTTKNI